MKMAMEVDIGVIYSGEEAWTARLLETLRRSGSDVTMRLLLVDNASPQGVADLGHGFPCRNVLSNHRRLSYARNVNRILAASSGPFVLVLNTDVWFDPRNQCISRMVRFMNRNPHCGIAGCRIYHADGSYAYPARRFPSLKMILARRCPFGVFRSALARYLYSSHDRYGTYPCDWISGCLMMIRRKAIQQVGVLDDRFIKYFEDVDYCRRMKRAGWQVMHNGSAYAFHLEQRASVRPFSLDTFRHLASYARWLAKYRCSPA